MTRTNAIRRFCLLLCACLLLDAVPVYADTVDAQEALDLVFEDIFA